VVCDKTLSDPAEEAIRVLLEEVLGCLRIAGQAPLGSRLDSRGTALSAISRFRLRVDRVCLPAPDVLLPALDAAVEEALADTGAKTDRAPPILDSELPRQNGRAQESRLDHPARSGEEALLPLAAWLDRVYEAIQSIDARASEVVALRVEGFTDREIAERLELGLRLVKRILCDLRAAVPWGAGR